MSWEPQHHSSPFFATDLPGRAAMWQDINGLHLAELSYRLCHGPECKC